MAAIYSNGGNRWNILGFNFTKRDALSSVYKISMEMTSGFADYVKHGQGRRYRGGGGGVEHPPPPPTRQQIGKLLSQSAKLYWLKITTEETKIDFLNN